MKCDHYKTTFLATCLLVSPVAAPAATFSGNIGDSANPVHVGSNLGAASFADPSAVANSVALYNLVVPAAETVDIRSTPFAAGGADPYFSLFKGSGGSATFLASNYAQAFSTGGDFDYSGLLAAGQYEFALGDPGSLGDGSYAVQVTLKSGQPPLAAPEIDAVSMPTALTPACRQHPDLKRTPAPLLKVDLLPGPAKRVSKRVVPMHVGRLSSG